MCIENKLNINIEEKTVNELKEWWGIIIKFKKWK